MIEPGDIEKLKQRADILAVISRFVELKKVGASYVGLCPFHDERSPSFTVNRHKNFFHCFGCKMGGDVFKFIMEFEKLGFTSAVERVAALCNFPLSYTKKGEQNTAQLKNILPLLNAFFKAKLSQHSQALAYLYSRGLNDADIQKFELGFAPDNDKTLRLLTNEGISQANALAAGALKKDHGGVYASFIRRISFPIYSPSGALAGFGGRTLDPKNAAKYVNSPHCVLFDKSRILYALNLAKEAIIKQGRMIICEGYLDVIALHKAGLDCAVAVLGTALTPQHLPLIKRYEARVILCFDGDEAGQRAAERSAYLLATNKIEGAVMRLNSGKDPAELVAAGRAGEIFDALDAATECGEFYIRSLVRGPLDSPLAKQRALEAVQNFALALEPLVAHSYVPLVAGLLGVGEEFVPLGQDRAKAPPRRPSPQNKGENLAEYEILNYLQENPAARELLPRISSPACFKHRALAEKILAGAGYEDEELREFAARHTRASLGEAEFLLGICRINLAFLNKTPIKSPELGLKKQLFTLLARASWAAGMDSAARVEFLRAKLVFLKSEKGIEALATELGEWRRMGMGEGRGQIKAPQKAPQDGEEAAEEPF